VTDNQDPDNHGRVRVQLPYFGPDFRDQLGPGGRSRERPGPGLRVDSRGHDEVLVGVHHGDVSEPYVLGGLWNQKDPPPSIELDGDHLKARSSSAGPARSWSFSDESGKEGILVSSADGTILVQVDSANKKVVITANGGGKVEMKAQGDITIDAQGSGEDQAAPAASRSARPAHTKGQRNRPALAGSPGGRHGRVRGLAQGLAGLRRPPAWSNDEFIGAGWAFPLRTDSAGGSGGGSPSSPTKREIERASG